MFSIRTPITGPDLLVYLPNLYFLLHYNMLLCLFYFDGGFDRFFLRLVFVFVGTRSTVADEFRKATLIEQPHWTSARSRYCYCRCCRCCCCCCQLHHYYCRHQRARFRRGVLEQWFGVGVGVGSGCGCGNRHAEVRAQVRRRCLRRVCRETPDPVVVVVSCITTIAVVNVPACGCVCMYRNRDWI